MNLSPRKKYLRVFLVAVVILIMSVVVVVFWNYVIVPKLDEKLQSIIQTIGNTFIILVGVFASIANFTGLNVKEFLFPSEHNYKKDEAVQNAEKLLDEIQADLYGDNAQLPRVLALCIDLCDRVGLNDEYGEWLSRELNGYPNVNEFRQRFPTHEEYEEWMDRWAIHRQVDLYMKVQNGPVASGRVEFRNRPLGRVFTIYPVSNIITILQDAGRQRMQEMSILMRDVDPEFMDQARAAGVQVDYDMRVFMNLSEYERILNTVRENILALLSRARQILAEQS